MLDSIGQFIKMEICIEQKQLIFTIIGRSVKWSIDLKFKKKYDIYIISDDKPFRNNANQDDIIYFWNSMHQESKKSIGYTYLHDLWYVMNTQCMKVMRSNDIAIANQLSVISTIYIYAIIPVRMYKKGSDANNIFKILFVIFFVYQYIRYSDEPYINKN